MHKLLRFFSFIFARQNTALQLVEALISPLTMVPKWQRCINGSPRAPHCDDTSKRPILYPIFHVSTLEKGFFFFFQLLLPFSFCNISPHDEEAPEDWEERDFDYSFCQITPPPSKEWVVKQSGGLHFIIAHRGDNSDTNVYSIDRLAILEQLLIALIIWCLQMQV